MKNLAGVRLKDPTRNIALLYKSIGSTNPEFLSNESPFSIFSSVRFRTRVLRNAIESGITEMRASTTTLTKHFPLHKGNH